MIISYISAFVITVSLAEKAILKVIKENHRLFISKEILDEVLNVKQNCDFPFRNSRADKNS